MKVKALELGFFDGSRIRAGQVFEVPDGTKGSWFVPVDSVKAIDAPKPAKGKGKKGEAQTLSEAANQPVQTFAEAHGAEATGAEATGAETAGAEATGAEAHEGKGDLA